MTQERPAVNAGIDVSKDWLDLYALPGGMRMKVRYSAEGLEQLAASFEGAAVERVVLEATGKLEAFAAATLAERGLPVVVVNPRQVRDFARASGRLAKSDTIDAEMIARFGEAIAPEIRPLPSAVERRLAELLARRRQLVEMAVAEKNRLYRTADSGVRSLVQDHLRLLRQQVCAVDGAITQAIEASPEWRARDELLRSVPGIGRTVSYTLLSSLPELGRLDKKAIASLAGLAPFNHDSGAMRGKRAIKGGREAPRRALYMATLTGIRRNPVLKEHYQGLVARGKPPKVAIVACMRKLLVILNAMAASGRKWQQQD